MAKKRKFNITRRFGEEAEGLREAGRIAAEILCLTCGEAKAGKTTGEIDAAAAVLIEERDCKSAFLGYKGFPGHICISVNEEIVHGIGGARVLKESDIVKIDVGILTRSGWVGDNAKTITIGKVSEDALRLMRVTEEALYVAIEHAREGELLSRLCASVENYVSEYDYTVVKEFVGHGVGRALHEEPQIPNYWDSKEARGRFKNPRLQAGMVMAIEPMVNAGTDSIIFMDDKWTVITADRALSAHFEHTVLVTKGDPEILTPRERSFSPVAEMV